MQAANYISVDLSDATIRVAVVTSEGEILERREASLSISAKMKDEVSSDTAGPGSPSVAAQIIPVIATLRESFPRIAAVCVGLPGLINRQMNRVVVSSALPTLLEEDLHATLIEATGLRVALENDANAAAYAEYKLGAGRESRNMFYVTLGVGVGGAIILDGKLWTGANGFAGEFGHIVIDPEGIELESMASAVNIVRRIKYRLERDSTSSLSRLAMNPSFTVTDIVNAAQEGDDFAMMMLERTGRFIGMAIASVINLLNLEKIVIGGSIMEAGDLILNPLKEEARRLSFEPCYEATDIITAELGFDAVAIGSALLLHETMTLA
jgi:glucokinase